jgi:hypothetical protein
MAQKRSAPAGASSGRSSNDNAKRGRFDKKTATGKQQSNSKQSGNASKSKGKAAVRTVTRGGAPKIEEVKRRKMPLTGSVAAATVDSDAEEDDEMDVDGDEDYEQEDHDMEVEPTTGQHSGGADAGGENKRLSKGEYLCILSLVRAV